LRHLALLDQRSVAAGTHPSEALTALRAYVDALGRRGDAQTIVSDLFERGQLLKFALSLSPETRRQLFEAALANGLSIPDSWYEDAELGAWVATITELEGRDFQQHKAVTPIETLERAQRLQAELDAARSATDRISHEAKRSFLDQSADAFHDLELTIDGYVQLWNALGKMGISQVAALGSVIDRDQIDPTRHHIVAESEADRFLVRRAGVVVDGEVVTKSQIEGLGG
jgi:hypothetical protein